MNVVQHGGLFKASRIAGPKHNYLGLAFCKKEQEIQLIERRLRGEKECAAAVNPDELIRVVRDAVTAESEANGQRLFISTIEFVPTDSPDLLAYTELARAIVKYTVEKAGGVS